MPGRHQQPSPRLGIVLSVIAGLAVVVSVILALRGGEPETTTTIPVALSTTPDTSASTSTTLASSTTAVAVATTLADPLDSLFLAGDGIGEIGLGTPAEAAISQLSATLGLPDDDTDWTANLGTCPGTESRIVRWSSLQIFLTDGETAWATEPHFFHYGQSLAAGGGEYLDLRTEKEIGIGSTISELKSAYGEAVIVGDDPAFGPYWEVAGTDPSYLWGTATGVADDSVIDALSGGAGCGE
ncbi:MAG TPA: hypothetical protein VJ815_01955 [Acidimicrobiia bacterium]|nr:hypothetical protein [Acidimicrobiia bacterium]